MRTLRRIRAASAIYFSPLRGSGNFRKRLTIDIFKHLTTPENTARRQRVTYGMSDKLIVISGFCLITGTLLPRPRVNKFANTKVNERNRTLTLMHRKKTIRSATTRVK